MVASIIPVITAVPMARESKAVSVGQTVTIGVEIKDSGTPGLLTLLDPTEIPTVTIFNPAGTAIVTDGVMSSISTGKYAYYHQTLPADAVGQYTATFNAINVNEAARLEKVGIFTVLSTGAFSTFTFFRIKDQTAQVFYWWVDLADTLDNSLTSPTHVSKLPVDADSSFVPEFIQVVATGGATRFVFPDITGAPTVASSAPGAGAGRVGSPTLIGISGNSWLIGVNAIDEVILNAV